MKPKRRYSPLPVRRVMELEAVDGETLARRTGYHGDSMRAMLNGYIDQHGKRDRGLTWYQADRLAVALGHHPVELWGDEWFRVFV